MEGGGRVSQDVVSTPAQEPVLEHANGHDAQGQIDAILALKAEGVSVREISRRLGIPRATVQRRVAYNLNSGLKPSQIKRMTGKYPWDMAGVSQTTWHKCLRAQKRIENKYHTETEEPSQAS